MNVNEARMIAQSDLAQALRSPITTAADLVKHKRAVELAEAEVELADARAAAAAEARAVEAAAKAEADALAAEAAKVAERQAAQAQAGVVANAIATARNELTKLLRMPGVHSAGLEIVVLKTNRSYSATVPQSLVHDVAAAAGLPSPNDTQRRAAIASQHEAHRLATAEIVRMAEATRRGAAAREALSGPGLPQRGMFAQNRRDVLN